MGVSSVANDVMLSLSSRSKVGLADWGVCLVDGKYL